jgi:hypothetical protein
VVVREEPTRRGSGARGESTDWCREATRAGSGLMASEAPIHARDLFAANPPACRGRGAAAVLRVPLSSSPNRRGLPERREHRFKALHDLEFGLTKRKHISSYAEWKDGMNDIVVAPII